MAEGEEAGGALQVTETTEDNDGGGREEEEGALLHQFTRTSVESQPGSLEDIDTNAAQGANMAAGDSTDGDTKQGRSRWPGRTKRRKPKDVG